MNLNMYIIREDLKGRNFGEHLNGVPYEANLCYPVLCDALPENPDDGTLYILTADELSDELAGQKRYTFLCAGLPSESWFNSSSCFLYYETGHTTADLMNEVSSLFYKYARWEHLLQEVVDKKLPLRQLAQRSQEIVSNCIFAQGGGFRALFYYIPELPDKSEEFREFKRAYAIEDNSIMNSDAINTLISDPEYNHASESKVPTIYSGKPFGFRSLYYNVYSNGVFIARVTFDEVIQPITEKDYVTIRVFGNYLGKALMQRNVYNYRRPYDLDSTLQKLLSHRLLPEKTIINTLKQLRWDVNDDYMLILLRLNTQEDTHVALEPIALNLSHTLDSECYTIYENHIVFVLNLTQSDIRNTEIETYVLPTLRDNLLTASFSTTFRDFKNLYYYYQQAKIAEKIGVRKNPTFWYFRFENYHLDYLIYKCRQKTIPEVLIPEGLRHLMDYDRKKGTEYTHLLRVYLDCDRNIAETSRLTYLHRNTILYRLKRIGEIVRIDLDNADNRLILEIAFRVIDDAKKQPPERESEN